MSDRIVSLKLEMKGVMFSVVSVYNPQAECQKIQRNSGVSWMKQ